MYLFLKGFIIGFAIAAPIGPIGILCIKHTLENGFPAGLVTGLGAATADILYGGITVFGLSLITGILVQNRMMLAVISSLLLLVMGILVFLSKAHEKHENARVDKKLLFSDFVSTFFLTLTNPFTLVSFPAIFAGFGFQNIHNDYLYIVLLLSGTVSGSVLWWIVLSGFINHIRRNFTPKIINFINKISGVVLVVFAVFIIISVKR